MSKKSPRGKKPKASKPLVAIVMGSESDFPVMKAATEVLDQFAVPFEVSIKSAHRTPDEMTSFAKKALARGVKVIIAGAGGAAHLPGMVASYTELPVIGVPVAVGALNGQDSLLSIVQMPKGVPVATVAIGNSFNAALLAVQILATGPRAALLTKLKIYRKKLRQTVLSQKISR